MVQIKKKVTLKAKTEQEPVVEPIQQSTKPTLRKKEPVKEPVPEPTPTPTPTTGGGDGKSGNSKIYGGIAAAVVACLLGYGAYSYYNSSDEKTDDTTTEIVEGTADTSNEGDSKEQNNDRLQKLLRQSLPKLVAQQMVRKLQLLLRKRLHLKHLLQKTIQRTMFLLSLQNQQR